MWIVSVQYAASHPHRVFAVCREPANEVRYKSMTERAGSLECVAKRAAARRIVW